MPPDDENSGSCGDIPRPPAGRCTSPTEGDWSNGSGDSDAYGGGDEAARRRRCTLLPSPLPPSLLPLLAILFICASGSPLSCVHRSGGRRPGPGTPGGVSHPLGPIVHHALAWSHHADLPKSPMYRRGTAGLAIAICCLSSVAGRCVPTLPVCAGAVPSATALMVRHLWGRMAAAGGGGPSRLAQWLGLTHARQMPYSFANWQMGTYLEVIWAWGLQASIPRSTIFATLRTRRAGTSRIALQASIDGITDRHAECWDA